MENFDLLVTEMGEPTNNEVNKVKKEVLPLFPFSYLSTKEGSEEVMLLLLRREFENNFARIKNKTVNVG